MRDSDCVQIVSIQDLAAEAFAVGACVHVAVLDYYRLSAKHRRHFSVAPCLAINEFDGVLHTPTMSARVFVVETREHVLVAEHILGRHFHPFTGVRVLTPASLYFVSLT